MFVFSRFGSAFEPLDTFLLLVAIGFAAALVRRALVARTWVSMTILALALLGLLWTTGRAWIVLEHGRPPILLAPFALLAGWAVFRRLTGGNAAAIGGALVTLLLLLGAAPILLAPILGADRDPNDIAFANTPGGLYEAVVVEEADATRAVLRPRRLNLKTLFDYPQTTVYTPGFGTEADSVRWETPTRLVVELVGSGEIEGDDSPPAGIDVVASREIPDSRPPRREIPERPSVVRPFAEP